MTPHELAFADAILSGANHSEAYRRAYDTRKMKWTSIKSAAWVVVNKPHVEAYIAEHRARIIANVQMTAEQVLNEWITVATADPQELVRTRVRACRHCHGTNHAFQWRNDQEWAEAAAKAMAWRPKYEREDPPPVPGNEGGMGYSVDLPPIHDCPNCNGDGEVDHLIADTRSLSPAGRKLYAGVKVTKDGIQILMRDQDAALQNVAKYLGMLVEKRELTGKNGGPVVMQVTPEDRDL